MGIVYQKKILLLAILLLILISFTSCGTKQKRQWSQYKPTSTVSRITAMSPVMSPTPERLILVSPEKALEMIAERFYGGNTQGMEISVPDPVTGHYTVSWRIPGGGTSASWDVDPVTGDAYETFDKVVFSLLNTTTPFPTSTTASTSTPSVGLETDVKIEPDLKKFIEDLQIDGASKITNAIVDDIDKDGNTEYLITLNRENGNDTYLLVRENSLNDPKYQKIDARFYKGGYSIYQMELIKLDNSGKKYIYAHISNGASLEGCAIYNLDGNKVTTLYEGASATGAGTDEPVDENNDGIYEKVVSERSYSGFFTHTFVKARQWNGTEFQDSKEIESQEFEYPQIPEDVIKAYTDAYHFTLESQISEMTTNENVRKIDVMEIHDPLDFVYGNIGSNVLFETLEDKGHTKTIQISNKGSLTFKLVLMGGKWKIDEVIK